MVIGVPTIKRERDSYLSQTLTSLIDGLNDEERDDCLIIVFIGEASQHYYANVVLLGPNGGCDFIYFLYRRAKAWLGYFNHICKQMSYHILCRTSKIYSGEFPLLLPDEADMSQAHLQCGGSVPIPLIWRRTC